MKSRKTLLIIFLVITSIIGFATLQENIFHENQLIEISESSSDVKTITVAITDGVGSGDKG